MTTGPDESDFNGHLSNSSYAKVYICLLSQNEDFGATEEF
jgi:hypothetical protein